MKLKSTITNRLVCRRLGPCGLLCLPTQSPMPRVLANSVQQATLASSQVQVLITGLRFNTKAQLMVSFKIMTHLFIGYCKKPSDVRNSACQL